MKHFVALVIQVHGQNVVLLNVQSNNLQYTITISQYNKCKNVFVKYILDKSG